MAQKQLLILGGLGAVAAAGYYYYESEMDHKEIPHGCLPQTETKDKSDGKPASPPGTEAKDKSDKKPAEKPLMQV